MERLIVSGFGGQGVLSVGLLLAEAGVKEGLESTFFPAYGAEMRGGTANCQVILSEDRIGSPIIIESDSLIAFNEVSINRFLPQLMKEGMLLINSSVVTGDYDNKEKEIYKIPADEMAVKKIGNNKVSNIIMLGAFLKKKALVSIENVMKAIKEKFISKGEKIIKDNFNALELGYSLL